MEREPTTTFVYGATRPRGGVTTSRRRRRPATRVLRIAVLAGAAAAMLFGTAGAQSIPECLENPVTGDHICLSDVPDLIPDLEINPADLATYEIHTIYTTPEGEEVATVTPAVMLVPTPVDVEGEFDPDSETAGPDILVQLQIDATRATLRVTTLAAAPDPLPLRVEAVLADPRQGSPLRVAFGYDARADTAPETYTATITLVGAPRVTSFSLDVTTVAPGSTLGVVAEVFRTNEARDRIDPQRGRIDYTPVPAASHFGVIQGSDLGLTQSGLDLITDRFTTVEVLIEDIIGGREDRFGATIDQLPHTLSLLLTEGPGGTNTWNYRASAIVDLIEFRQTRHVAGELTERFHLQLEEMATNVVLFEQGTRATLQANRPIGAVQIGSSRGRDIAWLSDPAYFYTTTDGATSSLAFRILGLSEAELDTGEDLLVDVRIQPGPFRVLLEDRDAVIEGWVRDLPSRVRLEFSERDGRLRLQGSEPINEISIDAYDPSGISGRADRLELRLLSLPTDLEVTWRESDGTFGIQSTTGQIGLTTLLLTSGPDLQVDGGFDGVVIEDVPSHYATAVRLEGLREVRVSTGTDPASFVLDKTPGPFLVQLTENERVTRLEIRDLPRRIEGTFDVEAGTLALEASDPVDLVSLDMTDPGGVSGRATELELRLHDLPTTLSLTFSGESGVAELQAGGAGIRLVTLHMTSGPRIEVDAGFDGIVFEDVASHYALAARLEELRHIRVDTGSDPAEFILKKKAGPFLVQMVEGDRVTRLEVLDLPDSMEGTFGADSFSYVASSTIDEVRLDITDPAGVVDRATELQLRLEDLSSTLSITFSESDGIAEVNAGAGRVEQIRLLITSGPALEVDAGYDGIVLENQPSHYALAVRLQGLQLVRVTTGEPPYDFSIRKDTSPFLVRLDEGPTLTQITVHDLPAQVDVTFDPAGRLDYQGSAVINEFIAELVNPAGVAGRATRASALLRDIPQQITLDWSQGDGALSFDAGGDTLGLFELLLTSGPTVTLPAARDGAIVQDLSDRYVVFARLTGLRRISFDQGPPPSLSLDTTASRIFEVDLQTQKSSGVARTRAIIDRLPASLTLSFSGPTTLTYRASAPVASLTIEAVDPDGISGRATQMNGSLQAIPRELDIVWQPDGRTILDARGGTLGLIEFQLTSGPDLRLGPSFDGILIQDVFAHYVLFGRITGLREVDARQQPLPDIRLETTGGRVLRLDVTVGSEYTRVTLDRLQPTVRVWLREPANASEIFYRASAATNSLVFETNSGSRQSLVASLTNPMPASIDICTASNGYCTGFARSSGAGSVRFSASEHTTLNVNDQAGSGFTQLNNWRIRHFEMDADSNSSGESGYIFTNTTTGGVRHTLTGSFEIRSGGGGFRGGFGSGFWSDHRRVSWSLWGLFKSRSGSINCTSGTSLQIRILGIWIGVTSYMC